MKFILPTTLLLFLSIIGCKNDLAEEEIRMVQQEVLEDDYANWMANLVKEFPDQSITLKKICMPSAHDAGTYLFKFCTGGANACNTRTQQLNMTKLLEIGVRDFDIRPVFANNKYFTQHVTECGGLGCRGDWISSVLEHTKSFVDEHEELVILNFSHFCNTNAQDEGLLSLVNDILDDRLYKDSGDQSVKFLNRPLGDIISFGSGKGKVIIKYDGVLDNAESRANGIFSNSYLQVSGSYSNSYEIDYMAQNQKDKMMAFNSESSNLFGMSWTMTLDAELSIACAFPLPNERSIKHFAEIARSRLGPSIEEMLSAEIIYKGKIPNLIALDYINDFAIQTCLDLSRFNLAE